MTRTIAVVSAGLRSPSTTTMLAGDLSQQVVAALGGAVEVTHVEVREHAHALMDALLSGFATGALHEALDAVAAADGLIVVTPTFAASYAGLFKTFFDVLEPDALRDKPVLLAATGGTERHSLMLEHALRPLFSYLGAQTVSTAVFAATQDFGGAGTSDLHSRIARAASELASAIDRRPVAAPPSESGDLPVGMVPFEHLLG